ncbi:MAG: SufS family cysteine desulfurase [Myxococcaceae bacterium]|nr:SufS family cysteine desulfurase [Myxococcaceae bacterium]MBH2006171.1 SufS family cysteine desulfurase [Myxococcaceae bacterium]
MDIAQQFPLLNRLVHGRRLVYLDTAATALKPLCVIEAERAYEQEFCANVHRGVHALSEQATREFESARSEVQHFIQAPSTQEIIFTSGTTESINLLAHSYSKAFLKPGDEIWISSLEHHSNLVPWQMAAKYYHCHLKVIPLDHVGEIPFGPTARLLAVTYASNALGVLNPLSSWIAQAKAHGMQVLIDAAQAAVHVPIDVQALGCDFLVFSGHKVYGPTGTGILWGREHLLEQMPPYQMGGDMIESVRFEDTRFAKLPAKFEAGTPNIAGVIGLGEALRWLKVQNHEALTALTQYAREQLLSVPGLRLFGDQPHKMPLWSFLLSDVHPHDISSIVDREGVAIRAGHLCAQPLMQLLGVSALVRASFGLYNTREDVDALVYALHQVRRVFRC